MSFDDPSQHSDNKNQPGNIPLQMMRVIWGVLLMSLMVYGVVGTVDLLGQNTKTPDPNMLAQVKWVLFAISLATTIAIFFLRRTFKAKAKAPQGYITYCILSWALSEAIAIYGLVLRLMGASTTILYGMIAWSALLMILFMPTERDREDFLKNIPKKE